MKLLLIACLVTLGVSALSSSRRLGNKFKMGLGQTSTYNNYEHFYAADVPIKVPDFSALYNPLGLNYHVHAKASDLTLRMPWSKPNDANSKGFTLPLLTCSAGDYWGPYKASEWLCDPTKNTEARLLNQFDNRQENFELNENGASLARFDKVFSQTVAQSMPIGLDGILDKISKHKVLFANKINQEGTPSDWYIKAAASTEAAVKVVVGTAITTFLPPSDQLTADTAALAYNDDHFSWCAKSAYHTGHTAAQKAAFAAGQKYAALKTSGDTKKDKAALEAIEREFHMALAKDGFATHFLSDLFAAGHVRTPRFELRAACAGIGPVAGLVSNVMHDEDNFNGLYVTRADGRDGWVVYGDHFLFEKKAKPALDRHQQALRTSFAEVTNAFVNGLKGSFKPQYGAFDMIPTLAGLDPLSKQLNPCPLYRYEVSEVDGKRKGRWWIRQNRGMKVSPYTAFADRNALTLQLLRSPDLTAEERSNARTHLTVSYGKATQDDLTCPYELFTATLHCCQIKGRATPQLYRSGPLPIYTNLCKGVENPNFTNGPTQRFPPSP